MYLGGQLLPKSQTLVPQPLPSFLSGSFPDVIGRVQETGAFEGAKGSNQRPNHVGTTSSTTDRIDFTTARPDLFSYTGHCERVSRNAWERPPSLSADLGVERYESVTGIYPVDKVSCLTRTARPISRLSPPSRSALIPSSTSTNTLNCPTLNRVRVNIPPQIAFPFA
jgi:hypothetical protein